MKKKTKLDNKDELQAFIESIEKLENAYTLDSEPVGRHLLYEIPMAIPVGYSVQVENIDFFFTPSKHFIGFGTNYKFHPRED